MLLFDYLAPRNSQAFLQMPHNKMMTTRYLIIINNNNLMVSIASVPNLGADHAGFID